MLTLLWEHQLQPQLLLDNCRSCIDILNPQVIPDVGRPMMRYVIALSALIPQPDGCIPAPNLSNQ